MTSIEERLRAADPMAGQEYHPADLDAMIARIVTPARRVRPVRDPVWATFKTRVAVALAGTATAMTLGITLLAGLGNSLPALSFATVSSLGANAPVSMALMPTTNYVFSASSDLPTASGTAPTYVLSPVGPRTALARVATALSLDLGTLQTYDFGQSYSASGPLYSAWSQQNQGYSSWGLAANTLTTYGYGTQSASEAVTAARSFASTLTDLPLGTPTLTQIPAGVTPPLTPGVALSTFDAGLTVSVPVLIGTSSSDLSYAFTFAPDGTLLSASGVAFTTQAVTAYPLLSPADAVSQISSQMHLASGLGNYGSGVSSGSQSTPPPVTNNASSQTTSVPLGAVSSPTTTPTPTYSATTLAPQGSASPTTTSASSPSGTTPPTLPTPTVTATTPPASVTITGYTMRYGVYQMANGNTMLLPVYVYTGIASSTKTPVTFIVVPIDPTYLDFAPSVTNY